MSTTGIRPFRPNLHFTPQANWINDPNGLVYVDGVYHLFCQYHPESTVWGPMHWAHATSTDLSHWQHQPVALAPDPELGMIFSGSCVYDKHNTSGLGSTDCPPMVAMFTHHGEHEQQSIAYSTDGVHFEKYHGNPVIANTDIQDFRDPKVFYNPKKQCWSMVLSAGDRAHFYTSPNLLDWTKSGEFGPEGNYAPGVWECPDLFPLTCDGQEKWVLLVSMILPTELGGSHTQYFIGDFDGDRFIADPCFTDYQLLDDGFDNYAGVTFANTGDDVVLISWGLNWSYAREVPTNEYCGMMTLPRKMALLTTPNDGMRLSSTPLYDQTRLTAPQPLHTKDVLTSETFVLQSKGNGACCMTLQNKQGQTLCFGVDEHNQLFVDRSLAGANDFDKDKLFAREVFSKMAVPRFFTGDYTITAIFDVCSLEVYIDDGTRNCSAVVFADQPYNQFVCDGAVTTTVQWYQSH